MNTDPKTHWEKVYATKPIDEVSWFQEHAEVSLRMILRSGVAKDGAVIDVGGGASMLVDDLLDAGFSDITVLDISAVALSKARERLGKAGDQVHWIEADVTKATLPEKRYDLWHDRAVFHFLTDPADRAAYVDALVRAVKPGGHVIVSTFAHDGPEKCSGLPVVRYDHTGLHQQFGDQFRLTDRDEESHRTPFGAVQHFIYCYCRLG